MSTKTPKTLKPKTPKAIKPKTSKTKTTMAAKAKISKISSADDAPKVIEQLPGQQRIEITTEPHPTIEGKRVRVVKFTKKTSANTTSDNKKNHTCECGKVVRLSCKDKHMTSNAHFYGLAINNQDARKEMRLHF